MLTHLGTRGGHRRGHRGFTIVELIASAGAVLTVLACVAVCIGEPGKGGEDGEADAAAAAKAKQRQIKDATQIRGIHQGMVIWAQNNADKYPLPSEVDKSDMTVADRGKLKDTTSNIMSLLVFNGFFSPELLVSPVENNGRIVAMGDYAYDKPKGAISAEKALWDPAFSADFTRREGGNMSYAHLQPAKGRLARWSNTFNASEPIVSNRGPEISDVAYNEENTQVTMLLKNPKTVTMKFFGEGKETWHGNISFNDNHVEFKVSKVADSATASDKDLGKYKFSEDRTRPDIMFFDEPDDSKMANDYLGIFTKAGEGRGEWKAIWD